MDKEALSYLGEPQLPISVAEVKAQMIYGLTGLNDPYEMFALLSLHLQRLYPSLKVSYIVAPFYELLYAPTLIYIRSDLDLHSAYISSIKKKLLREIKKFHPEKRFQESFRHWLRSDFYVTYLQEPTHRQKSSHPPAFEKVLILEIDEGIQGVFHLSGLEEDFWDEEKEKNIMDLIEISKLTVNRVKKLITKEHSRYLDMLKSSPVATIVFNRHGEIIFYNKAIENLAPLKSFTMASFYNFFKEEMAQHPEYEEKGAFQKSIKTALIKGETTFIDEVPIQDKYFSLTVLPIKESSEKITGGALMFYDITHLKEIDNMKTEFVSVASHQLRTPLSGMHWALEMLLGGDVGTLNEEQREYIEDLAGSNKRMISLVNQLLNVSRIESGRLSIHPQETHIVDFLQTVLSEAQSLAQEKEVSLKFHKPRKKFDPIDIDTDLIHQVIHNLITNAIRYSYENKKSKVEVTLEKDGVYYLIKVKDQGIGIPKKDQKNIFQKFFRASNAIEKETDGTGFGLYLAKMIMDEAGGNIWFESQKGKGTTFFVQLPVVGMKARKGDRKLEPTAV